MIAIIDYGAGNVHSVQRAFEHCGAEPVLTADSAVVVNADRLVLPGVGAFADGMRSLRERGLIEPIRRFVQSGRPFLGICLGMQMLATSSEEFGVNEGLNLMPGRVVPIPSHDVDGVPHKIPHIGWAELVPAADRAGTIFEDTPEGTSVYLVHSFKFEPDAAGHRLADCFYGGHRIAAAVRLNNMTACQFHPEKSGEAGLRMIAAFLRQ
ncbi:imidazole glycerol phosphate synthase subunit HisH [Bradyrhizobium sp. KBS0727]|uniref:imidazole glycerol phosphate synthase subunit HisH n=1 Tax=unclassified Bradyrhizobium TaxID=2631580 RepID=UPI00110F0EA2|nr:MULTISPECIES: imidazole glycerol phosphate synthase subunit HisH [unclassified Bradyrhizobium]QDW39797.1 imidazole glycerol phosphate synthase subunit HisH [Bradyrhizobium sp. KBS0725]QDW46400.1 imidazole glycerol phosphate synthase subunit HisH [Bradyrhizobium sp. KBS0727]